MREGTVRPIALAVILNSGKIFVTEGSDRLKGNIFYRPPGGGIELGEKSDIALKREMAEEFNTGIDIQKLLGVLENIFTYEGKLGHEIVFIYAAGFIDNSFYGKETVYGTTNEGHQFKAKWIDLEEFIKKRLILYPDGLLELLQKS